MLQSMVIENEKPSALTKSLSVNKAIQSHDVTHVIRRVAKKNIREQRANLDAINSTQ